jgi:hypothetical protein
MVKKVLCAIKGMLTVGEYRELGFVGTPFRDSARGINRTRISPKEASGDGGF